MLNRFPPMQLPPWAGGQDFVKLSNFLLSTLPLARPTPLTASLRDRLHHLSGGVIGGLVYLLQRAACHAIKRGVECITPEVLDAMDDAVAVRKAS